MKRTIIPKYQKRNAKERTFKYTANNDMFIFTVLEGKVPVFLKGKTYNMTVKDMYSYITDSELQDNHLITREWLKENFTEVSA